ncbi:MAG: hypothetical protein HY557_01345 [Euryarchaeota archaeon]|nr:hypothetical protein [Euryarchaeota archaeon]
MMPWPRGTALADVLARTVAEVEPSVKDYLEVAVVLEIVGVTDDVVRLYGYDDVFALARAVEPLVEMYRTEPLPVPVLPMTPPRGSAILFFAGMFYNLWWVIMLVALFLGGQSLWASVRLPPAIATSIGLGVIFGLVTTGGIQQFAAWKMTYYLLQDNKPLARFVVGKSLFWGVVALLAVASGYTVLNEWLLPQALGITALTVVYFLLIGLFRLLVVPVYAMKRYLTLFAGALVALGFMFGSLWFLDFAGLPRTDATIVSQTVGLLGLIAVSAFFLYVYVYRERSRTNGPDEPPFYSRPEKPRRVQPPRFAVLFHDGLPLIAYGSLFFAYLFADRLVAWWVAASNTGQAAVAAADTVLLTYNTSYQIGVDMALLMLIPLTGVKFVYIYRLSDSMRRVLRWLPVTKPGVFGRWLATFYSRMMVSVWIAGLLFTGVGLLLSKEIIQFAGGDATSLAVFRLALIGVFFFSIFLANAVFSLAFRRTWGLAILLFAGIVANVFLAVNYATSANPSRAVLGFVLSAIYLGLASILYVYTYTGRADYAHYTAM